MSGVPIFPTGIVKQYTSPIPFVDTIDLQQFSYETFKGSTKLRTAKYLNILLDPEMKDIATWIEMQAKDYLDNELGLEYEEFFFSESWLNIYPKGGSQPVHNHVANDCQISGCYYHNTTEEMGDLTFHTPNPYSDIDLWGAAPQNAWVKTYPSSTIIFPSWLNHNTDNNQDDQSKISIGFNIQVGRIQTGISGSWLGKDTVIHDRGYKMLDGKPYESS